MGASSGGQSRRPADAAARYGNAIAADRLSCPLSGPASKSVIVYIRPASTRCEYAPAIEPGGRLPTRVAGGYGNVTWAVRSGRWLSAEEFRSSTTYVLVASTLALKAGLI